MKSIVLSPLKWLGRLGAVGVGIALLGGAPLLAGPDEDSTPSASRRPVQRPVGQAPQLTWTLPAAGTQAVAGIPVNFQVQGLDPLGVIPAVTFLADGKPIGTALAPAGAVGGAAVTYGVTWTPTIQVTRALSARAVTTDGVVVKVEGPKLTVIPPAVSPVVRVSVLQAEVTENDPAGRLSFQVERDGATTDALTVAYVLTGKAAHGVDYRWAPPVGRGAGPAGGATEPSYRGKVTIPAGARTVVLDYAPLADTRTEGDETLVWALAAPTGKAGLEPAYRLGTPASGTGVIHDFVAPPAELPVISVVATAPATAEPTPTSRIAPGVFTLLREGPTNRPVKVFYRLSGTARNGRDYSLLDGDVTIPAGDKSREIAVVALSDTRVEGEETVTLSLRSRATYRVEAPKLATVTIRDGNAPPQASLVLTEPVDGARYTNPVEVVISAEAIDPAGYVSSVEFLADGKRVGTSTLNFIQAPPPGTPLTHSVKWVNPPLGVHVLQAQAVTEAGPLVSGPVSITVVAAAEPPPVVRHPADTDPADDILAESEVEAYATAWRTGAAVSGGLAPIHYVTRAGYLLRNGGGYRYESAAGELPLAWVTRLAATLSGEETDPVRDGLVSFGVAEVPQVIPVQTPFGITLRLVPVDGVLAHAVEEWVGTGATVTEVSDGGQYDSATGMIRWGLFLDDTTRKLTAKVSLPEARELSGMASFDGAGLRVAHVPPPPPLPLGALVAEARIASVLPLSSGGMQLLVVDGVPGTEVAIEVSTDLAQWQRVEQTTLTGGTSAHLDSDAEETQQRFYRLVPVSR